MELTLYRKYQPLDFDYIKGQNVIKKILKNSIIQNKVSHAYIFAGPRGIGKTSIAKIFSRSINCLNNINGNSCNTCNSCKYSYSVDCMDIIELDAASNNGVSEIRSIIESVKLLPQILNKKIYIIDEAHMLTNSSWNALLKTLENPPKHAIFIFATTDPFKIPLTIVSRCQRFDLQQISKIDIFNNLDEISKKENININNDSLKLISELADGSMRDALSILGQLESFKKNDLITVDIINQVNGLVNMDRKIKIIKLLIEQDLNNLIELIRNFEQQGINFLKLIEDILKILIDKIIYKKTKDFSLLKILSLSDVNSFEIDDKIIYELINILKEAIRDIKTSNNPSLFFEMIMLNCYSAISEFNSFSSSKIIYKNNEQIKEEIENKDYNINNSFKKNDIEDDNDSYYHNKVINTIKDNISEIISNKDDVTFKKNVKFNDIVKLFKTNNTGQNDITKINEKTGSSVIINNNDLVAKNIDREKIKKVINEIDSKKYCIITSYNNIEDLKKIYNSVIEEKTNNDLANEINDKISNYNNVLEEKNIEENLTNDTVFVDKNISDNNFSSKKKQTNNTIKIFNQETTLDEELIERFCEIAFNNNSNENKRLNKIISTIRDEIPHTPEEGYFVDNLKIIVASENGFVVEFEDFMAANSLNKVHDTKNFLLYVRSKFGKIYFVLGVSKWQLNELKNIFKNKLQQHITRPDVNIDNLKNVVNNSNTVEDLAKEVFGDLIDEGE